MSRQYKVDELHILVGLPGAGKSYFANELLKKNNNPYQKKTTRIADFDALQKKLEKNNVTNKYRISECIRDFLLDYISYPVIIADGFFPTFGDIRFILSCFLSYDCVHYNKIIIDYWVPDKDICLKNDAGRRSQNSYSTIMNTELNEPQIDELVINLPKHFDKAMVKKHYSVQKPNWESFFEQYTILDDGKPIYDWGEIREARKNILKSRSWCTGGTARGWNGSSSPISPEEPMEFDEFDDLLEKVCPQITFLAYKDIRRKCVTMVETDSNDYYVSATNCHWECDLEMLYKMLVDYKFIKEED